MPFRPDDGMHVLVLGRVTVYEKRGIYQILVEDVEPRGIGAIHAALEKLRARLEAEGLFDPERKRSLPRRPARVGIVTSPSGAAIQDILKVFRKERTPVHVILSPAFVQGAEAPRSIVDALRDLEELDELDLIMVGRGGGSFEDLLAFSDEEVVRAVSACRVPVISAVGHEIDVTLTDLAADIRAATPTAGAQIVASAHALLGEELTGIELRLVSSIREILDDTAGRLRSAEGRLVHPRHILDQGRMRLDDLSFRISAFIQSGMERRKADLDRLAAVLASLGPQAVLDRGYAVVQRMDGTVVRRPAQVEVKEELSVRLASGDISVEVTGKGKGGQETGDRSQESGGKA